MAFTNKEKAKTNKIKQNKLVKLTGKSLRKIWKGGMLATTLGILGKHVFEHWGILVEVAVVSIASTAPPPTTAKT